MAQVAQPQHLLCTWPGSFGSLMCIVHAVMTPDCSAQVVPSRSLAHAVCLRKGLKGRALLVTCLAEGVAPGASGPMSTAGMPTEYTVILR